jgi:hypothetical protein
VVQAEHIAWQCLAVIVCWGIAAAAALLILHTTLLMASPVRCTHLCVLLQGSECALRSCSWVAEKLLTSRGPPTPFNTTTSDQDEQQRCRADQKALSRKHHATLLQNG